MKYSKTASYLINLILAFLFIVLINGRPLLGLYLFGYRIGEYLTAFGMFFLFIVLVKNNFFTENISKMFLTIHLFLVLLFVAYNIFDNSSFTYTYIYRNSVYIWYITYFYIGFLIFRNITLDNFHYKVGYAGLFIVFIFNTVYFPDFLYEFFTKNSDKFQFLKGSEIILFFVVVVFFSNRFNKQA